MGRTWEEYLNLIGLPCGLAEGSRRVGYGTPSGREANGRAVYTERLFLQICSHHGQHRGEREPGEHDREEVQRMIKEGHHARGEQFSRIRQGRPASCVLKKAASRDQAWGERVV